MTTYQRATIHSAADVRAVADHAGSHFFSPDTMRCFGSRLLDGVWAGQAGRETKPGNVFLFVTSERHGSNPRHYAVRLLTLGTVRDNRPAVDIVTVGDYHATPQQARRAALSAAQNHEYLNS